MIRYNEQGSRVVGQERVLVIEDQLSCRQLVSDYLRQNGYSVDEAASLSAGRRAVDVLNPSIVILDLSLDDGDGFDILPDLKKRGISALVLSSRSDALDRILSFELGAADYMSKPVELREMVTSPGGTTIRAIRELEQAGVRAAFLNAINAAMERSKELARGDD